MLDAIISGGEVILGMNCKFMQFYYKKIAQDYIGVYTPVHCALLSSVQPECLSRKSDYWWVLMDAWLRCCDRSV